MKISEIVESRKNPQLNPKISINSALQHHYSNAQPLENSYHKNSFVSFTELEKLGVNPQSAYTSTPNGIYAYPTEYVLNITSNNKSMKELPYGGDLPYANLFSVQGNIIELQQPETFYSDYYNKINNLVYTLSNNTIHNTVNILEKNIISDDLIVDTSGCRFWHVTYLTSKLLSDVEDNIELLDTNKYIAEHIIQQWNHPTFAIAWSRLLRTIGIDGIIDNGDQIIHESESTQAVFFSKHTVKHIIRVNNKHAPDDVSQSIKSGQQNIDLKYSNNPNTADIIQMLIHEPYRYFDLGYTKVPNNILKKIIDTIGNNRTLFLKFVRDTPYNYLSKSQIKYILDNAAKHFDRFDMQSVAVHYLSSKIDLELIRHIANIDYKIILTTLEKLQSHPKISSILTILQHIIEQKKSQIGKLDYDVSMNIIHKIRQSRS